MDSRTQERVERWDSRPFSGGYETLSSLAEEEFSGAVTADRTWLFMLNGRIVGVIDGSITAFENATGTTYVAPDPALPLLATMEATGGETRAKYYTNETPLREVDETLTDGSFTGYVKLSEDVLSGDYYAVYYGGRRMAAAYIGNAERLLTGDEAFERAADEVGIYEVIDVDIDVTDVPEHGESTTGHSGTTEAEPSNQSEPANAGELSPTETPVSSNQEDTVSGETTGVDRSTGGITAGTDPVEEATEPNDSSQNESRQSNPTQRTSSTAADQPVDNTPSTESQTKIDGTDLGDSATDRPDDRSSPDPSETGSKKDETATSGEHQDRSTPDDTEFQSASVDTANESSTPDTTNQSSTPNTADQSSTPDTTNQSSTADAENRATATPIEGAGEDRPSNDESDQDGDELEKRLQQEEQWRETRQIPSIDPERTAERPADPSSDPGTKADGDQLTSPAERSSDAVTEQNVYTESDQAGSSAQGGSGSNADRKQAAVVDEEPLEPDMLEREDKIDRLTQRIDKLEQRHQQIRAEKEELASERDQIQSENTELRSRIAELQEHIAALEAELESVRGTGSQEPASDSTAQSVSGNTLDAKEALSATNLFVRYDSKSQPTLESAHAGKADVDDVASNIRLEHHTQFDESDVTVDGRPYEEFLTASIEYQFVQWLTGTLLYEIRDTDHSGSLQDLYDVIPRIDRAELYAPISLEDDDTEDVPDQVTFDIVAFDKRGVPLVVANVNDSRDPATQQMLVSLEEASSAVNANYPDLGAAFVVTSSFFDPGALEVTEQATSGSFLSRGSKLSYVNLSRKQGYHLCLVESRDGGFHMNVPEL